MNPPTNSANRLRDKRWPRIDLTSTKLTLIVAAFLLVAYNATYWSKGVEVFSGHVGKLIIFNLAVYCLTVAFFGMFSFRPIVKPFLALIILLTAASSFYMDRMGVVVDREMVQNIVTTTVTESKHLITREYLTYMALYGLLPAAAIFFVRLQKQRALHAFGAPVMMLVLGIAFAAGLLMSNLKTYASVLRERKDLMSSYQPGAPLVGMIRYAKMVARSGDVVVAELGTDASKGPAYETGKKPVLTIVVAGETARAQNFSLNGYEVETNPELAKRDVVNFSNVSSCGTATAVSLPCMFSKYTRASYSYERGVSTETLLDVLGHAGFAVEWWENNTGDKNIAARFPKRSFTNSDNAEFCPTGECDDGIFLEHLKAFVPTITQDTVLVLHQIGSHGPTYYLRYPESFEKFQPACRTAEFKNCTPQEITNAYDNTIAYTDLILSQTIDFLEDQEDVVTSLLYISDHGESLGESGLYLHGAPYFMAPEQQTKVPMILWLSKPFSERFGLSRDCLSDKSDSALSHDNLFHSVLGLLDVRTNVKDQDLDIFGECRTDSKLVSNG